MPLINCKVELNLKWTKHAKDLKYQCIKMNIKQKVRIKIRQMSSSIDIGEAKTIIFLIIFLLKKIICALI